MTRLASHDFYFARRIGEEALAAITTKKRFQASNQGPVQGEEVFEEILEGYQRGTRMTAGEIVDHIAKEHKILID
jgi:hypothetical protein